MIKTLADYTPQQRYDLIGTWCETPIDPWPAVLVRAYAHNHSAILYSPSVRHEYRAAFEDVTPLLDQPRAWQADGTPVKGTWVSAKQKIIPDGNARYDRQTNMISGDSCADMDHEPCSDHDIRYWIGDWERIVKENTND